jgi:hypothetical protein
MLSLAQRLREVKEIMRGDVLFSNQPHLQIIFLSKRRKD